MLVSYHNSTADSCQLISCHDSVRPVVTPQCRVGSSNSTRRQLPQFADRVTDPVCHTYHFQAPVAGECLNSPQAAANDEHDATCCGNIKSPECGHPASERPAIASKRYSCRQAQQNHKYSTVMYRPRCSSSVESVGNAGSHNRAASRLLVSSIDTTMNGTE